MKPTNSAGTLHIGSLILVVVCSSFCVAEEQSVIAKTAELPQAEINSSECCSQVESDQLQELRMRLASVQDRVDKLEQTMNDFPQEIRKKDVVQPVTTTSQKVQLFLKENALSLTSLVCTVMGMYISYYFNHETLKLNQASFVIDKGEAAWKHLSMMAAGQYGKYKTLVDQAKAQKIA